jgi:hypothetical protein
VIRAGRTWPTGLGWRARRAGGRVAPTSGQRRGGRVRPSRAALDRRRRHAAGGALAQAGCGQDLQGWLRVLPDAGLPDCGDGTAEALAGILRPGNAGFIASASVPGSFAVPIRAACALTALAPHPRPAAGRPGRSCPPRRRSSLGMQAPLLGGLGGPVQLVLASWRAATQSWTRPLVVAPLAVVHDVASNRSSDGASWSWEQQPAEGDGHQRRSS